MIRLAALALVAPAACAGTDNPAPHAPHVVPADAAELACVAPDAPAEPADDAAPAIALPPEQWLRGSTHVHARPSGDSITPIADVIAWYEQRGYDFIALTDHNQVSELAPDANTSGSPALRDDGGGGLIVLAGIELTHNPVDCLPAGDASGRCRIHVNLLGATARPGGKLEWAERKARERVAKYQAALNAGAMLGGIAQLNHPQWYWGMTPDVLTEVARRGMRLIEIANVQFTSWNQGDRDHLSTEALWDAALGNGVTLWGVASDDAHDYHGGGRYPAGGGWVVVKARRDARAILDALAGGRFYSSTGVALARAELAGDELVVEVDAAEPGVHAIDWIENGQRVATVRGKAARRALPASGYLRAVVTRDDGKQAWIQPARR